MLLTLYNNYRVYICLYTSFVTDWRKCTAYIMEKKPHVITMIDPNCLDPKYNPIYRPLRTTKCLMWTLWAINETRLSDSKIPTLILIMAPRQPYTDQIEVKKGILNTFFLKCFNTSLPRSECFSVCILMQYCLRLLLNALIAYCLYKRGGSLPTV